SSSDASSFSPENTSNESSEECTDTASNLSCIGEPTQNQDVLDDETIALLEELHLKYHDEESSTYFQNNPQRLPNEEASEGQTTEHPRLGNHSWCECGKCVDMPTVEESICCKENGNIDQYMEGLDCICEHHTFKASCLYETIMTVTFRVIQSVAKSNTGLANRSLRITAYRFFTLGKRNCLPIPSCVVKAIRDKFPDPESTYVGFKYYDYAAVDMAKDIMKHNLYK
ncbi:hypothetical protein XELAEV_18041931mg, partial [Xenopus laevis]